MGITSMKNIQSLTKKVRQKYRPYIFITKYMVCFYIFYKSIEVEGLRNKGV